MYKIMIVEDDMVIAKAITKHLIKWNYEVRYIKDFRNIIKEFIEFNPQLVLLDISLPFYNGYHWCSEIRKLSKVPIIFISSTSDNMNMVMAMDIGGDDFIVKPFDLSVLIAKINALMRRTYSFQRQVEFLEHSGVILNLNNTSVTYKDKKLELTKNDFKIMQVLMENQGGVVSRNLLISRLWESDNFIDDNTLTVNITRLRKKLETINVYDFIKTKKGLGYVVE
ncbi:response regulator transcription factor [Clostridium sp. D2Q-14]|uniref:response regulator transcription factor n=1 Tax=Anaeromonas gelatinilytica TaxID=2683194 RepID=UPI00193B7B31|nr:response regulator transcription factor [Anaeromonas gelatinilytica]MBS4534763.1 response regulator transcription factor [Anaeromonas gelatinilytica]